MFYSIHLLLQEGKEWYLMDSAWVASWLAYVHLDVYKAPCPGPCRNNRLIEWDPELKKYTGRFGLQMAVKNRGGDYRRVSKETWLKFKEFYPESGPAITMYFQPSALNESGNYDTSTWTILDPPPPPEDPTVKKKKKKKGVGEDTPLLPNAAEAGAGAGRESGVSDADDDGALGRDSAATESKSDRDPPASSSAGKPLKPGAGAGAGAGAAGGSALYHADSDDDEFGPGEVPGLTAAGVPTAATKNQPRVNYEQARRTSSSDSTGRGRGPQGQRGSLVSQSTRLGMCMSCVFAEAHLFVVVLIAQ